MMFIELYVLQFVNVAYYVRCFLTWYQTCYGYFLPVFLPVFLIFVSPIVHVLPICFCSFVLHMSSLWSNMAGN